VKRSSFLTSLYVTTKVLPWTAEAANRGDFGNLGVKLAQESEDD
jgi:hypothetical protein